MPIVVDASVAAKWFVPEEDAEAAQELLHIAERGVQRGAVAGKSAQRIVMLGQLS